MIVVVVPISLGLLGLLAWMTFRREKPAAKAPEVSADEVVAKAAELQRHFKRIGVALGGHDLRFDDARRSRRVWPAAIAPNWC